MSGDRLSPPDTRAAIRSAAHGLRSYWSYLFILAGLGIGMTACRPGTANPSTVEQPTIVTTDTNGAIPSQVVVEATATPPPSPEPLPTTEATPTPLVMQPRADSSLLLKGLTAGLPELPSPDATEAQELHEQYLLQFYASDKGLTFEQVVQQYQNGELNFLRNWNGKADNEYQAVSILVKNNSDGTRSVMWLGQNILNQRPDVFNSDDVASHDFHEINVGNLEISGLWDETGTQFSMFLKNGAGYGLLFDAQQKIFYTTDTANFENALQGIPVSLHEQNTFASVDESGNLLQIYDPQTRMNGNQGAVVEAADNLFFKSGILHKWEPESRTIAGQGFSLNISQFEGFDPATQQLEGVLHLSPLSSDDKGKSYSVIHETSVGEKEVGKLHFSALDSTFTFENMPPPTLDPSPTLTPEAGTLSQDGRSIWTGSEWRLLTYQERIANSQEAYVCFPEFCGGGNLEFSPVEARNMVYDYLYGLLSWQPNVDTYIESGFTVTNPDGSLVSREQFEKMIVNNNGYTPSGLSHTSGYYFRGDTPFPTDYDRFAMGNKTGYPINAERAVFEVLDYNQTTAVRDKTGDQALTYKYNLVGGLEQSAGGAFVFVGVQPVELMEVDQEGSPIYVLRFIIGQGTNSTSFENLLPPQGSDAHAWSKAARKINELLAHFAQLPQRATPDMSHFPARFQDVLVYENVPDNVRPIFFP